MDRLKENTNPLPSVLTSVLEQRAAEEITEQDIARFRAKWSASAAEVKLSTRKSTRKSRQRTPIVKLLAVAASVALIFCSLVALFSQSQYYYSIERNAVVDGSGPNRSIAQVEDIDAAAALAAQLDAIRFIGGECACGHENPSGAYIEGNASVLKDRNISWEIKAHGSNLPVSVGEGSEVTAAFTELKNAHSVGRYTLFFYLQEGDYQTITMRRDFEIS